jgi:hypothetical protein
VLLSPDVFHSGRLVLPDVLTPGSLVHSDVLPLRPLSRDVLSSDVLPPDVLSGYRQYCNMVEETEVKVISKLPTACHNRQSELGGNRKI